MDANNAVETRRDNLLPGRQPSGGVNRREVLRLAGLLGVSATLAAGGVSLASASRAAAAGARGPARNAGISHGRPGCVAAWAQFPPRAGDLFYGASEGPHPVLAQQVGRTLGIDREYFTSSDRWQAMVAYASAAAGRGSVPVVSIKEFGQGTWADIANGDADTWLHEIINGLVGIGAPVVWTIHHEPENDVAGANTAASFKAMTGHVASLHPDPATTGVYFGPIVMGGRYNPLSCHNLARRDLLVDWVHPSSHIGMFDAYNHGTDADGHAWRTPTECADCLVNGYSEKSTGQHVAGLKDILPDKPIIWAEYGVRPMSGHDAPGWLADQYTYCTTNQLAGCSYFSSSQNVNDGGGSWQLTGSRLAEFTSLINGGTSVLITS